SLPQEQRIHVYELDAKTGSLELVESFATPGAPGSLGFDPQRRFLYASLRSNSSLAAHRVDAATGRLTAINAVELPRGENAAFVGTDRTGRWLISASYSAGKVFVHRLGDDGAIASPMVQTVETAKTAHCVSIDRGNRWVFIPHVAPNAVYQFKFDSESGKLTAAGQAAGGAPGAGPRHLAFHPTLDIAFSSDESGSSVTSYDFSGESGLKPRQTLSTLPDGYSEKNSTAEVKVHPNGKFVWVSNRGHDSLAGFSIAADGKLAAIGQTPTEKTPRSFDISPDGLWAFGAGEGSGQVAVFKVDPATGRLERRQTVAMGKSVSWVTAICD
ncbi:MAG TPA: beta-propeller fold lactonase family protein, partial [Pirellulaceae bacterium]|nr:beta-propeller fold lactonase family protein [Pirellulaceae bacterium]